MRRGPKNNTADRGRRMQFLRGLRAALHRRGWFALDGRLAPRGGLLARLCGEDPDDREWARVPPPAPPGPPPG